MEDCKIVELYWAREQEAICQTQSKYGNYCHSIARNILHSDEDAQECVNDTYHNAWNAMPPHRPQKLRPFLGRITRNLALNRYDYREAKKRGGETELVLDEYAQCIPNGEMPIEDEQALRQVINGFLGKLSKRTRIIFLRRYWYLYTIGEIAQSMGLTESNVKIILHRTRNQLKAYLEKEGIFE